MAQSFQNEIPPARINLKLDVGKGAAKKKVELPLKMLVLGDFSSREHDDRVVEREKIAINKNNFTQAMESMDLRLEYSVEDKISESGGDVPVSLKIKNMDSFKPEHVAKEVPALSRLLAARNLIKDLKSNLLDNRQFRKRLEEIIKDPGAAKSLQEQLKKVLPEEQAPTAS
ncbi:MAG: type VI secretion system contractile sheath small subunit [Chitinivibrionales bacterium]|nr:type VI secretion system contractile sheath small subunit [Chitinivibrionales bacterium]MBD3394614.1 type VI secretion system contractile sheath small subunit [Chitinivibrionales bacterium]